RTYGEDPGTMGDALPYVDLGAVAPITQMALGADHSCALFQDGRVKCWGSRYNNLLRETFDRGVLAGDMGDSLPYLDFGGKKVKRISVRHYNTCFVMEDDTARCRGTSFASKQEGVSTQSLSVPELPTIDLGGRKVTQMEAGTDVVCALLDAKDVKCWGRADSA